MDCVLFLFFSAGAIGRLAYSIDFKIRKVASEKGFFFDKSIFLDLDYSFYFDIVGKNG